MNNQDDWHDEAKELAMSHVDWLLGLLRPLLIEHMIHGFKHGRESLSADKGVTLSSRASEELLKALRKGEI